MTAKRAPGPGWTHAEATRQKETALAELRQLELAVKRGEYVKTEDIQPVWARRVLILRAGLLSIPGKLRLRMPHLSDHYIETIKNALHEEMQIASLTEIPPMPGDGAPGDEEAIH